MTRDFALCSLILVLQSKLLFLITFNAKRKIFNYDFVERETDATTMIIMMMTSSGVSRRRAGAKVARQQQLQQPRHRTNQSLMATINCRPRTSALPVRGRIRNRRAHRDGPQLQPVEHIRVPSPVVCDQPMRAAHDPNAHSLEVPNAQLHDQE